MVLYAVVLVTLVGLVVADFDAELHTKYLSMSKSSFIEYFNARNYSWKMADYGDLLEKYRPCVHRGKESMEKLPIMTHNLEAITLPIKFDSRINWPQCETIKKIYDQGRCGSCWAFGTATTASDRTCIHKDIHVRLSEQDFECLQNNVCSGGYPEDAFRFWQEIGLVSNECKPYDIEDLKQNKCNVECVNSVIDYKQDKHYADYVYRVEARDDQIKAELVKNGPIEADFPVYEDFKSYHSGVYVHTFGELLGFHSVRIIGYGVEDGKDYWLVANSWGTIWGDKGLFKIQAFQGVVDIEKNLRTGTPKN